MHGNRPVCGNASMKPCCSTCWNRTRFNGNSPVSTRPACHPPQRIAYRPSPTDRSKLGCKYNLLVNQRGLPLVASILGAQVHDSRMLIPPLEAVPSVPSALLRLFNYLGHFNLGTTSMYLATPAGYKRYRSDAVKTALN